MKKIKSPLERESKTTDFYIIVLELSAKRIHILIDQFTLLTLFL